MVQHAVVWEPDEGGGILPAQAGTGREGQIPQEIELILCLATC
jgi:hypothetical protein